MPVYCTDFTKLNTQLTMIFLRISDSDVNVGSFFLFCDDLYHARQMTFVAFID